MNNKFGILCLGLLVLPACGPWNFRHSKLNNIQQQSISKKLYLYISDVECKDCFALIQGILLSIKGVREVCIENPKYDRTSTTDNKIIVSYDPAVTLNYAFMKMMLEEWTFNVQKIEIEEYC